MLVCCCFSPSLCGRAEKLKEFCSYCAIWAKSTYVSMHSVASYVCRQYHLSASSLQVPCICNASAYPIYLQCICNAEKSATHMHLVQNPRIPPSTSATHMQVRKISNADASQMQATCRQFAGNLQGTCKELADKFKKDHIQYGNLSGSEKILRSSPDTVLVNERL